MWPGAGTVPRGWDKQERGDRYWHKKNCVATLAIMQRIASLVDHVREKSAASEESPLAVTEGDDDLDREVATAEAEAARYIAGLQKRASGKK